MPDPDDLTPDPALEALLRHAAPAPRTAWAAELERTLVPSRPSRSWVRIVAGATGLAAVIAAVSLAGGGPLAPNGGTPAKAKPGCELIYVTKAQPSGEVVQRPDGSVTVETAKKPVTTAQQRCR